MTPADGLYPEKNTKGCYDIMYLLSVVVLLLSLPSHRARRYEDHPALSGSGILKRKRDGSKIVNNRAVPEAVSFCRSFALVTGLRQMVLLEALPGVEGMYLYYNQKISSIIRGETPCMKDIVEVESSQLHHTPRSF